MPLLERASYPVLFGAHDIDALYVVGRDWDELRSRDGRNCLAQPGLLPSKLGEGRRHPFIRAVAGDEEIGSVVDGTMGLGNDAVHLASLLRCRVVGIEGSPLLHALLEDGVLRFARDLLVQIELVHGMAADVLAAMPSGSHDVVCLDPMMSKTRKSAPSFALVRELALPDRATPELLREAARVAKKRVVLKLGKGAPLPEDAPIAFHRKELGAHVVYWVHDVVDAGVTS